MADPSALSIAYLTAHPGDAARVLERLPTPEAAALFERVPARVGVAVLAAMLPAASARVIGALDDGHALGLISSATTHAAVGLLRHVPEPRRSTLVDALPTAMALASRLLLGYEEDTLGAWADPELIALTPDTRAAEALARMRSADAPPVSEVWIVAADQRLIGVVDLPALLRAPEAGTLGMLMREAPAALSAVAPVSSATAMRGWERSPLLPVIERGGRLIGVLRRETLARALARFRGPSRSPDDGTVAGLIARGYWQAFTGLVQASLALLPAARRVLPEDK